MFITFNNLIAAIYEYWPDLTVKQYKTQPDHYQQCRLVVNSSPAKALQLSYWKKDLIQVDILPEYPKDSALPYRPYTHFDSGGLVFTNHGGHCFLFEREAQTGRLTGKDVMEPDNQSEESCSDIDFIDKILEAISK